MDSNGDLVQGICSEDVSVAVSSLVYVRDVLVPNQSIDKLLQDLKLLEAIFNVSTEEQTNEELVLSSLSLVHFLTHQVHARLLELADASFCRVSSGDRHPDAHSFQNDAKNFVFVVLDKLSRMCLRETSVFEKALQITCLVNQTLVACFPPVYNLENMTMEREDGDEVKKILTQFAEVLQVLRTEVVNCEELDAIRLFRRYYMLIIVLCEILPTTLTEFGAVLALPPELGEEFSLILLNPGFKTKYPQRWDYIDGFMKNHNDELATQCSELIQIANLFHGIATVTYHGDTLSNEDYLQTVKDNIIVLSFEIETIVDSIDVILKSLIEKDKSKEYVTEARLLVLKLMAHPLSHVREKCYKYLRESTKEALGVDAAVKDKIKDVNFLEFVVSDDLLTEMFFGLLDDSEVVTKCSQDILLYLMKGSQFLPEALRTSLLDAVVSADHPLEYHVCDYESLQSNFLVYLATSEQDASKSIRRFVRFLFANDESVRHRAMEILTSLLASNRETSDFLRLLQEMRVDLPSLVYTTDTPAVGYRALLTAEFDIERMDQCMDQLADYGMSIAEKRAAINELQLLLDSPELQKVFLARNGFNLIIKWLETASNQGLDDVIYPVLSTLFNLYVGFPPCRMDLLKIDFIVITLLKALLFLRNNPSGRKLAVQLLCLVVYSDNLQVFVAENRDANMDDNVSIFIPSFANKAVTFPFEVTFFSVDSKHKDPDSVLPQEVTKYFTEDFQNFSLLRVSWNLGRFGSVEAVTDNYQPEGKGDFQLAPLEYWRLMSLEISKPVEKDLELVKNAETHDDFATILAAMSLAVEHAKISGLRDLKLPLTASFGKYLDVNPNSDEDRTLMRNVLNFFARVVRAFGDEEFCDWLKSQFTNPGSVVMSVTEEIFTMLREEGNLNVASYSCWKAIYSILEIVASKESDCPALFGNLLVQISWNLQGAVQGDERFVSSLLTSLITLMVRSPLPKDSELLERITNSCIELTTRFQLQKNFLTLICVLLAKLSEHENVRKIILDDPSWILLAVSDDEQRLSASAFALLTTLLRDGNAMLIIDSIVKTTLSGGVLVLGLGYLFDNEESPLIRQQAATLCCALTRVSDMTRLLSELAKFNPAEKLAVMVDSVCLEESLPSGWSKPCATTSKMLVWVLRFYSICIDDEGFLAEMRKNEVQSIVLGLLHTQGIPGDLAAEILHLVRKLSSSKEVSEPTVSGNKNTQAILDAITRSDDLTAQLNGLVSLSLAISSLPVNIFPEFLRLFHRSYLSKFVDIIRKCSVAGQRESVIFICEMVRRCERGCVNEEFEILSAEVLSSAVAKSSGCTASVAATNALAKLLESSAPARKAAFGLGLDLAVGEKMLKLHRSGRSDGGGKKSRMKKVAEYSRLLSVLHNVSFGSVEAKKRITNCNSICYSIVTDWQIISSDDQLLTSLMKFFGALSCGNIDAVAIFVTTTPAVKRMPSVTGTVLSLVLAFLSDLFGKSLKNTKFNTDLYSSICEFLSVLVATQEGRNFVLKSDVIRFSSVFASSQSSKILSLSSVLNGWLRICVNLSLYESCQSAMYHDSNLICCLLDYGTSLSVSENERLLCLETLRNLCLGPLKCKMSAKDGILPKLCSVIRKGSQKERKLAMVAIWSVSANNERVKSVCRAHLYDWKQTEDSEELENTIRRIVVL